MMNSVGRGDALLQAVAEDSVVEHHPIRRHSGAPARLFHLASSCSLTAAFPLAIQFQRHFVRKVDPLRALPPRPLPSPLLCNQLPFFIFSFNQNIKEERGASVRPSVRPSGGGGAIIVYRKKRCRGGGRSSRTKQSRRRAKACSAGRRRGELRCRTRPWQSLPRPARESPSAKTSAGVRREKIRARNLVGVVWESRSRLVLLGGGLVLFLYISTVRGREQLKHDLYLYKYIIHMAS